MSWTSGLLPFSSQKTAIQSAAPVKRLLSLAGGQRSCSRARAMDGAVCSAGAVPLLQTCGPPAACQTTYWLVSGPVEANTEAEVAVMLWWCKLSASVCIQQAKAKLTLGFLVSTGRPFRVTGNG